MNIVGTPCRAVHWYLVTVSRVSLALNPYPVYIIVDPKLSAARLPITIPKQWYNGTDNAILSFSVSCIL